MRMPPALNLEDVVVTDRDARSEQQQQNGSRSVDGQLVDQHVRLPFADFRELVDSNVAVQHLRKASDHRETGSFARNVRLRETLERARLAQEELPHSRSVVRHNHVLVGVHKLAYHATQNRGRQLSVASEAVEEAQFVGAGDPHDSAFVRAQTLGRDAFVRSRFDVGGRHRENKKRR